MREELTLDLRTIEPVAAARFIIVVGAYRALHGDGPSWRQAARAASWTWREERQRPGGPLRSSELEDRMYVLRRAGLITFSRNPRSLDVTHAGRRWALSMLSPERVARAKELP